jgi:transcriptional regulator with XRE-family HTH domain
MITHYQFRMARAALGLTTRELGAELNLSAMAISRFERGNETVISVATAKHAEAWFRDHQVFFGPKDGVCLGENVFAQERRILWALYRILRLAGIESSSSEIIVAMKAPDEIVKRPA